MGPGSYPNGTREAEHNSHQDHAYARMAYMKLLAYTSPNTTTHGAHATEAQRTKWAHMLASLEPFPVQPSPLGPIFAEGTTGSPPFPDPGSNAGYPIAHFAAMHPAEIIDLASDEQLIEIARNTVLMENDGDSFAPGGAGFCLAWPPAAKVATRHTARALLRNFTKAIPLISSINNGTNNGWENDNGGGLEDIGATQAIHLMLLQTIDSALVLFPAWPADSPASFIRLRATGAFVVTAQWSVGGVVSPVTVRSEAGARLVLAKPWPKVCAREADSTGAPVAVVDEDGRGLSDVDPFGRASFPTIVGKSYLISECDRVNRKVVEV